MSADRPRRPQGLRGKAHQSMGFDPVDSAIFLTGNPDAPETIGTSFALNLANEKRKRAILGELGDTHARTMWKEFEQIAVGAGFELISRRRFDDLPYPGKPTLEHPEVIIAAHPDKKLLLFATSFIMPGSGVEVINNATIHGTVDIGNTPAESYLRFIYNPEGVGGSWGAFDYPPIGFSLDAREGLLTKLQMIEEQGFRYIDWHDPNRFLYMMTSQDEEEIQKARREGRNVDFYEQRRQEFLNTAPQWVRDFII